MKVRMTFVWEHETLEAIGRMYHGNRKKRACRSQVIQYVAETIAARNKQLERDLRKFKVNPDPHQQKLPGMEPQAEG